MPLKIKEIIKSKGFSMQGVADKLGITRDTLTRTIYGNPTVSTLEKIAQILDVQVADLFESGNQDELTALIDYKGQFYKANTVEELEKIVEKIKKI